MKSKKLLSSVLAVTVMSSLLFTGCKDDDKKENPKPSDGSGQITVKKDKVQELTFATSPGAQVNPGVTRTNTEWAPEGYVYEGLLRNGKDASGKDEIKPGVAEKWETSGDKLTYTFTLRDNAKWADGKPVTAEQFVYSWRRLVDPKSDCAKNGGLLDGIVKNAKEIQKGGMKPEELGIKAEGNKLIITLEKPCLYFLEYCFHPCLKPVREDYVQKYQKEMGKTVESIMGNGAYKCTVYEKNKMVFEKNENYWNKDTRDIQKITYNKIEDTNSIFSAFQEKQVDRAGFRNPDYVNELKKTEHVVNTSRPTNDTEFLIMNTKNEFLSNANIRKAIASGFSREAYINDINDGIGKPAYGLVPESLLCGGDTYTPGDFKTEIQKMDPKELLKKGLKELGKSDDPSQVVLRIVSRGTTQESKDIIEFFMEEFKKNLGITIKADLVDYTIMYDKMAKHDFELGYGGWFADWNDPSNFLDTYITGRDYSTDAQYSNKEFDELMDKGHKALNAKEAAEYYAKAERLICIDECVLAPFEYQYTNTFAWDYVKGYEKKEGLGFEDFEGIYISGKENLE